MFGRKKDKRFVKDTIKIGGITFTFGKVEWEDAFSTHRFSVEDLTSFVKSRQFYTRTTFGYYAIVNKIVIIISEITVDESEFDVTLVPLSPSIKIKKYLDISGGR